MADRPDRGCRTGKAQFPSVQKAWAEGRHWKQEPYKCRVCGQWHLYDRVKAEKRGGKPRVDENKGYPPGWSWRQRRGQGRKHRHKYDSGE